MTRLGLHINTDLAGESAKDYIGAVKPNVCKVLGGQRGLIEACSELSPDTKWIGRVVWNPQSLDSYPDFQNAVLNKAREHRGVVDFWEGYNEMAVRGDEMRELARLEVGLAERLLQEGVGACIGGFSTGFINSDEDFEHLRRAFEYCNDHPDTCWFHFHEYSAPYLQYLVRTADGSNQWDHNRNAWTGFSSDLSVYYDETLDGWLTLRYRMLRAKLVYEGLPNVRFVITEGGIDGGVVPRPGPQGGGFGDFKSRQWTEVVGDYAQQMHWYLWQMSHDGYVVGAVDFGFASIDPTWHSFDLSRDQAMLERMKLKMSSLPIGLIGTEPPVEPPIEPPPDPEPPIQPPVVEYPPEPRLVVLAGEEWADLVVRCGQPATQENVMRLQQANPKVQLVPGTWLLSPWHQVLLTE